METRQESYVEIGTIIVKGSSVFTVRVLARGRLSIKAHCGSMDQARQIAKIEADRLNLPIRETPG